MKKKTIAYLLGAAAILCLVVGGVKLVREQKAGEEYEELREEAKTEEPETVEAEPEEEKEPLDIPVDFEALQAENPDIYAWITIPGTNVDYPILQREGDNGYYLNHSVDGAGSIAGAIFTEDYNSKDFTDPNTIIYGHNMKNGSMFGTLRKFYEDEVYEKAPYFWIYTPDKIYRYDIFSCAEVAVDSLAYQITFSEEGSFEKYIDDAYSRSVVKGNDIKVTAEDKIVTLSTCTGNESTRFIVQGKLSKTYWSKKK